MQLIFGLNPTTYGWGGILAGASLVFFAYIGFDVVATTAEEARNPQKDLPIGIIGLLYAQRVLPKDAPEPSEALDVVGMILLSPGLALLLYGVSSIPEEGTVLAAKVLLSAIAVQLVAESVMGFARGA